MSKRSDARRRVQMEVVYPHTPERVWRALTDRRALAHWLMPNDFEPRLGHRFQFRPRKRQDGPGPVQCEVTALEAPRRLAYTWHAPGDSTPSEVTWTLEPVERGTRLRLEHTAADATADAVADALAADATADAATEALWTHRTFTLCALLSVGAPTAVTIRPRRTRRRVGLVMAIASGSAASMRSRS